jgi:hypothetical protein
VISANRLPSTFLNMRLGTSSGLQKLPRIVDSLIRLGILCRLTCGWRRSPHAAAATRQSQQKCGNSVCSPRTLRGSRRIKITAGHRMVVLALRSGRACAALILLVSLASAGLTALAFGDSLQEERVARNLLVSAKPVEEPKKTGTPGRPIEEDEPAFWSDVEVYKAGPGRPRPIVVVKRGKQPTDGRIAGLYQGLLAREIVRQGLMLSAREELGAVTRDVPVGDPDVTGKPDASFRIGSQSTARGDPGGIARHLRRRGPPLARAVGAPPHRGEKDDAASVGSGRQSEPRWKRYPSDQDRVAGRPGQ